MSELMEDDIVEAIRRRAKWENDDYICRGHILNGMFDSLFDIYHNVESAKELWDSLESKYMAEDASSKKFLVSNFNKYRMVDSRHVMEQFDNNKILLTKDDPEVGDDRNEITCPKSVTCPPDARIDLREESLRAQDSDKGKGKEVDEPFVNMTEEGKNKNNKQNKGKKRGFKENNNGSSSNKCGKTGHFKRDCRSGRGGGEWMGGGVWGEGSGCREKVGELGGKGSTGGEGNMKGRERWGNGGGVGWVDAIAWWIDSGDTTHVCKDHCWFKTYEPVEDGFVLYMGDDHFTPVHGKGSVVLKFSLGKSNTVVNVFCMFLTL
ncbi:zinc finger, CCHC-type containing protein [Tanacetum coccineum]